MSNRRLGKLVDPGNPQRGRRQVLRHLSGVHVPSAPFRRVYADLLDAPELAPPDEEEDMQAELMRQTVAARVEGASVEELRRIAEALA